MPYTSFWGDGGQNHYKTVPGTQENRVPNPRIETHSATFARTSRKKDVENQVPSGDRSQNDPQLELESWVYQFRNSVDSDPDDASHSENSVSSEIHYVGTVVFSIDTSTLIDLIESEFAVCLLESIEELETSIQIDQIDHFWNNVFSLATRVKLVSFSSHNNEWKVKT